jgi:3-dehydroquinate synthetase
VVIDVDFLTTLSKENLADGWAEMIKHEIIAGEFKPHSSDVPSAAEIADNLAVKVAVVKEDPFERTGRRALLNCGHTVGHAVEKASGYRLTHGKCVAIGCVEEAKIAVARSLARPDWPDKVAARFAAAGLPVRLPEGMSLECLRELMKGDKKRQKDTVAFALPCALGDVRLVPVDLGKEAL